MVSLCHALRTTLDAECGCCVAGSALAWTLGTILMASNDSERSPVAARHIRWSNFRSFRSAQLELSRVTVLIGTNNSGKSSLHRPLELMKQTLEIESGLPGLQSRGPLVDCGSFDDCSYLGRGAPMTFRIEFDDPIRIYRKTDDEQIAAGAVEFKFGSGGALNPIVLTGYKVVDPNGTRLLERTLTESGYDCHGLIKKGNPPNAALDRHARRQIDLEEPAHFLFDAAEVLGVDLFDRLTAEGDLTEDEMSFSQYTMKYIALGSTVSSWIRRYLGNIHYLGPIRAHPLRSYRLGAVYQGSSDSLGSELPEILFRVLSGEAGFYDGSRAQFGRELQGYMKLVGLPGQIETSEVAADAFSIFVKEPSGTRVNLADSAFGYSQALPLILSVLLSKENETLIVEQPEIHLNPALQGRLADLFVQGIQPGATAIVETHSEHFLNRLRFLVADGQLEPEDLAVYFVQRGPKQSRVKRVHVGRAGELDESWPTGFFGDSLHLTRQLARAQAKLKRKK